MKKIVAIIFAFILSAMFTQAFANEDFRVVDVIVVKEDVLEIEFSKNLDASFNAVREFIIEDVDGQEYGVLSTDVDEDFPNKVLLILDDILAEESVYALTVLDIKDEDGNTIESGINALYTFDSGTFQQQEEETAAVNIDDIDLDKIDDKIPTRHGDMDPREAVAPELQSAAELTAQGGETLRQEEVTQTVSAQSETNETLPQTGPELFILLLLAGIFAGGYTFMRRARV